MNAVETGHRVVSRAEWLEARKQFLDKEKEFTRQRDAMSRERQQLPWERVEKSYWFEGPQGKETLGDLFGGRTQLLVYHFMLGPGWSEGCKGCSYFADHLDGALVHLAHRDVNFVVVSRAPLAEIQAFQKRMGWRFPWVSSAGSDFNFDFQVSFGPEQREMGKVEYNYEMREFPGEEAPGLSAFYRDGSGEIFHTYSAYARGLDILVGTYNFLDVAPKGRDEEALPQPMAWLRHHDRYEESAASVAV